MSFLRKHLSALAVLACFAVAVVYVEGARGRGIRVVRRASGKNAAASRTPGLRRSAALQADGALAETGRVPWRYLSPDKRRAGSRPAHYRFHPLPRRIPAAKVSTNLFLSVLNL